MFFQNLSSLADAKLKIVLRQEGKVNFNINK